MARKLLLSRTIEFGNRFCCYINMNKGLDSIPHYSGDNIARLFLCPNFNSDGSFSRYWLKLSPLQLHPFLPRANYFSKSEFICPVMGSRLTKAIQKGAVGVGRGRHERIVPEISWSQTSVFPVQTSFAAKLLTNLRNQKDA